MNVTGGIVPYDLNPTALLKWQREQACQQPKWQRAPPKQSGDAEEVRMKSEQAAALLRYVSDASRSRPSRKS
jgi:hypothetical protein